MNHVDKKYIPGPLLIVDFEKAFDSISWEFIADVLDFFLILVRQLKSGFLFFTMIYCPL